MRLNPWIWIKAFCVVTAALLGIGLLVTLATLAAEYHPVAGFAAAVVGISAVFATLLAISE